MVNEISTDLTVDTGKVRLAKAFVIEISHNLTDAVLARFKVAWMAHEVTKGAHVTDLAIAKKLFARVLHATRAVLARIEVDTRPLDLGTIGMSDFKALMSKHMNLGRRVNVA